MNSPLADLLRRRIRLTGPLTVAEFMAEALGHPRYGYYTTRDPFGARGDFTTAPEISQMFGELIGLWCAEVWRAAGAPSPLRLVELGPGRGTLMADALRAARVAPDFLAAASVHLVETSPVLAAIQRKRLAGHPASWHGGFDEIPPGPVLVVANEFFDALPVRQFARTASGWRERMVGLDETGDFRFGLAPGPGPGETLIPERIRRGARPGDILEVNPAVSTVASAVSRRIAGDGGAALIVDYGHAVSAPGETLQALRGHERHDPLAEPGEADLTAHVDFEALGRAAGEAGAAVHGPIAQRDLLLRLGIELRAARLRKSATAAQARDIEAACERLISPQRMGTLFKALAITANNAPPPAFDPAAANDCPP